MLVVSMSDIANNPGSYFGNVRQAPFLVVDGNGKEFAEVHAPRKSIFSRLFEKKDDTIDGVHKPSRNPTRNSSYPFVMVKNTFF